LLLGGRGLRGGLGESRRLLSGSFGRHCRGCHREQKPLANVHSL
jgi:hypothetical protein